MWSRGKRLASDAGQSCGAGVTRDASGRDPDRGVAPKALKALGDAFAEGIASEPAMRFDREELKQTLYATPRRLSYRRRVDMKRTTASLSRGSCRQPLQPTHPEYRLALRKRLEKKAADTCRRLSRCADGPDHLYVAPDGKADYVWLRSLAKGQSLAVSLKAC